MEELDFTKPKHPVLQDPIHRKALLEYAQVTLQHLIHEHIALTAELLNISIYDVELWTDDGFALSNDGSYGYPIIKISIKTERSED